MSEKELEAFYRKFGMTYLGRDEKAYLRDIIRERDMLVGIGSSVVVPSDVTEEEIDRCLRG